MKTFYDLIEIAGWLSFLVGLVWIMSKTIVWEDVQKHERDVKMRDKLEAKRKYKKGL